VIVGIPRESKEGERRVALTPAAVHALAKRGHEVRVEKGAGAAVDFPDEAYALAGASPVDAAAAWQSDLVVKVKEIQAPELPLLRRGQVLFCYLHIVGEPGLARALASSGITGIAFEMVRDAAGNYPLLAPMSEIAGRLAVERGIALLGRAPGHVLVLGAGHAGARAAEAAADAGAHVTMLCRRRESVEEHRRRHGKRFEVGVADALAVERLALEADLVVGAVFLPGTPTPKLLPRSLVKRMRPGAVLVDVSIDAGGVAETSRPTTHADPSYVEEGVVHCCIANLPAAVPREASERLSAAAAPFVLQLAGGPKRAVRDSDALRAGVLLWEGRIVHEGIARETGLPFAPLTDRDFA
jgi:alanine dehydrogenase